MREADADSDTVILGVEEAERVGDIDMESVIVLDTLPVKVGLPDCELLYVTVPLAVKEVLDVGVVDIESVPLEVMDRDTVGEVVGVVDWDKL